MPSPYIDPRLVRPDPEGSTIDPATVRLDPEEGAQPEYGLLDRIISTGLRVVPSTAGMFIGGVAGLPEGGIGAIPGGMIGGAIGGGIGETLGEGYEKWRGLRKDISPTSIGVEAALGAIPLGKSATIGRAALKGAGISALGTTLHRGFEEGELPSGSELAWSGGLGALLGGGAEALGSHFAPHEQAPADADIHATVPHDVDPDVDFAATPRPAPHGPVNPSGFAQYAGADQGVQDEIAAEAARAAARDAEEGQAWASAMPNFRTMQMRQQIADEAEGAFGGGEPRSVPMAGPGEGFDRYANADEDARVQRVLDTQDAGEAATQGRSQSLLTRLLGAAGGRERFDESALAGEEAQFARGLQDPEAPPAMPAGEARDITLSKMIRQALAEETGALSPRLSASLGGGALGGLAGGTQGDTPEERLRNAAIGAGAGALGGSALARFLTRAPQAAASLAETHAPPVGAPKTIQTAGGGRLSSAQGETPVFQVLRDEGAVTPMARPMPKAQREDLGLEHFPAEQRPHLQQIVDEYGGLEQQRRGRQPKARTEAIAQELKLNAGTSLAPGTNLSAEGHRAYVNAVASVGDKLDEVSARIRETGGTDADILEQAKLAAAHRVLFASYAGLRTEAGRALGVYNTMARVMPSELKMMSDLVRRGELRGDMTALAERLSDLKGDPIAQMQLMNSQRTRSAMDKVGGYFTANLLSGVQTQLRNIFDNASRTVTMMGTRTTAGGYDALRAAITGKPREVFAGEAAEHMKGLVGGFDKALADAWFTLQHGFSQAGIESARTGIDTLHIPHPEFAGGLKNPWNVPGRVLGAADRFFRQMNASAEMHALSYAQARREVGNQGADAVARRMAELRMHPPRELEQAVAAAAERGVYQETPGKATRLLLQMKRQVPALQYVLPFVSTVSNIAKQGAEHSPLGFLMERARTGSVRERTLAKGEALFGTLALAPLAWMAANGRLSGAGPQDAAKRNTLYESGWRPNAIKMPLPDAIAKSVGAEASPDGEYWVNYQTFGPLKFPMSAMANGFEAFHDLTQGGTSKSAPHTAEAIAAQTVARIGKSMLDQSFLTGISDLIDAVNDPQRAAEGFFAHVGAGFVPMSGLLRNLTKATDTTVRSPEGVLQGIESGIPGMSQQLQPRLTRYGEPVTREAASGAFMAPEISPVQHDPIDDELSKIQMEIGVPSARLTVRDPVTQQARPLTPEEAFTLRQARGRTTRALLSAVMGAPGYETLPPVARQLMVRKALDQALTEVNDTARAALEMQRPDLLQGMAAPR